jgi:hypothetical protein
MILLKHSSTCSNWASVLVLYKPIMSSCALRLGQRSLMFHTDIKYLLSPCDGLTNHVPGKCDCYLFWKIQRSLDVGSGSVVREDQFRVRKHLTITSIPLPSANSRVATEYFFILPPLTYRRHSRYCLCSSYTACANTMWPSNELPFTTWLLHHRLAVGSVELNGGSSCCALDYLRFGFGCGLMFGFSCRNEFRACHEVAK